MAVAVDAFFGKVDYRGVAAVFGPGTSVAKAAVEMMKILLDKE